MFDSTLCYPGHGGHGLTNTPVWIPQAIMPVGSACFFIQRLTGDPSMKIARMALPFFFLMSLTTAILTRFPDIPLYLPNLMAGK